MFVGNKEYYLQDEFKNFRFTMIFISFPLCVLQLFLHFFADTSSNQCRVEPKLSTSESPVERIKDQVRCSLREWYK